MAVTGATVVPVVGLSVGVLLIGAAFVVLRRSRRA